MQLLKHVVWYSTRVFHMFRETFFVCFSLICFVSQALYFCVPFREQLLEYYSSNKSQGEAEENLLTCLAELFSQVVDVRIATVRIWYLLKFEP